MVERARRDGISAGADVYHYHTGKNGTIIEASLSEDGQLQFLVRLLESPRWGETERPTEMWPLNEVRVGTWTENWLPNRRPSLSDINRKIREIQRRPRY